VVVPNHSSCSPIAPWGSVQSYVFFGLFMRVCPAVVILSPQSDRLHSTSTHIMRLVPTFIGEPGLHLWVFFSYSVPARAWTVGVVMMWRQQQGGRVSTIISLALFMSVSPLTMFGDASDEGRIRRPLW